MLSEKDILNTLDAAAPAGGYSFIDLGHVYSYLIDCRLNIFRGADNRWAIAAERLGFSPRAGAVQLEILYFGNCLHANNQEGNYYCAEPIEWESFSETTDGEILRADAQHWLVRGQRTTLDFDAQHYAAAGIILAEDEPGTIRIEEAARLLVTRHRELFRATDKELYQLLPADLRKLLVLNEWYHRDYVVLSQPAISEDQFQGFYNFNKGLTATEGYPDFDTFARLLRQQQQHQQKHNQQQLEENRPGAYETWQQIARVIVASDPVLYKPTLVPNTHWKHWPQSGSL